MSIGKNTASAKMLQGYVHEVERIEEDQAGLREQKAAIFARAKAEGFTTGVLRAVLKIRQEKPHDRAEFQALLDSYLHALGMDEAPALFRHVGMMNVDLVSREAVLESLKLLVPQDGEFILKTNDPDGNAQVEDYREPEPADTAFDDKRRPRWDKGWRKGSAAETADAYIGKSSAPGKGKPPEPERADDPGDDAGDDAGDDTGDHQGGEG